jgi:hypothetical protein
MEYSPQDMSRRCRGDMVEIMHAMKAIDADTRTVSLWIGEFMVYILYRDVVWALKEYEKREPRANAEW